MRRITPTEAHRKHMVHGKEKKERAFPLAGDTDNDASYDQDEPEEMAVEQSSQVPVTPSVHQTTLSSLRIKANPTNVACQLLELSDGSRHINCQRRRSCLLFRIQHHCKLT